MKFKEKLLQIKNCIANHRVTLWPAKHRRLLFILLGIILLTTLALTLFVMARPIKVPPYIATYQVETQTTFGDIYNQQIEKIVVSHFNSLYKSERFVNDIALLESTYNTPDGFILCSQNEDFNCRRLGDALTKNVGKPPKVEGLKKSLSVAKKVYVAGQDRPCRETTYTLPTASDKNTSIQNLTASVCLDDKLQIPLEASFTAHYRVNDITEFKDLTIDQARIITDLNINPTLSPSDFTAPAAN